jgi:hypothetical protein
MFIALIKIYDYLFKHPVHSFVIGGATYTRQRSHNLTNWSKSRFHHRYVPFGILGVNGGPHGVLHELHVALVIHQDYRMCPGPVAPVSHVDEDGAQKADPPGGPPFELGVGQVQVAALQQVDQPGDQIVAVWGSRDDLFELLSPRFDFGEGRVGCAVAEGQHLRPVVLLSGLGRVAVVVP